MDKKTEYLKPGFLSFKAAFYKKTSLLFLQAVMPVYYLQRAYRLFSATATLRQVGCPSLSVSVRAFDFTAEHG
ncbi:hypothetical protein A8C56_17305 [Niabella ginsenosidivorans]|uniref:Uncharacterized protein n=1 Tax=Niabella ginsenosidivorans TaxID=1176587 RepID=A0A1A9I4L3_9BACT|nr:hypothetical protein A8C56_17305 [Niabella ginsenosidivorans]